MSKQATADPTSLPTARLRWEAIERSTLAPAAQFSDSAERLRPEEPCLVRTAFQRDRDRILHSKSFRRLKHKTQVFISPAGDHYRTRLTHTLEVTQVARTIGRALGLNEDLVEAIGLGHDLGHTPFGHAGESALASVYPGFRHNEQSLRVVDILENDGRGLNLTTQVRSGILNHSKPSHEITGARSARANSLEGEVVRLSDGIAYINHDYDDAVRGGIIAPGELPEIAIDVLGYDHGERIQRLVFDVVEHSQTSVAPGTIAMSEEVREAANVMRQYLFDRVYEPLNSEPDTLRAQHLVRELFTWFASDSERIPETWRSAGTGEHVERFAADYVASMTDRFAVEEFKRIFVPRVWSAGGWS